MSNIPQIFSGDKLVMILNGKQYSIPTSHPKFEDVVTALRENKTEDEILSIVNTENTVDEYLSKQSTDRKVEVRDGKIYVDGEVLHNNIANRIDQFRRYNLPVNHLIRFVERLENNPSFRSREQLYNFLEHLDLVITEDGYFLAYKSVTNEYLDHHTRSIDNHPGQTVRMERRLISDDPNSACSRGLHVGAYGYASTFGFGNCKMVIVKVDPANVVSVPHDCSCQKCRVCEYTVIKDADGKMEMPLYTTQGNPYKMETWEGVIDWTDDEYDDEYDSDEVYSYEDHEDTDLDDPEPLGLQW